jgi:hypothetical protein
MLEDPVRFLKALESTRHKDAGSLGPEELRCLKNLELIGNVSLGLARSLPAVAGSDTARAARERLQPAWERTRRRWDELSKTAASVFACGERISLPGGNRLPDAAQYLALPRQVSPPVLGATAPCTASAARPASDGGADRGKEEGMAHAG